MKCPYCAHLESKVTDSRSTDDGLKIRRRRECIQCSGRFTTYEVIEHPPLIVIKKDCSQQVFDSGKLLNGLMRACEKRPVSVETLQKVVDAIEYDYQTALVREITSKELGEKALSYLKDIDEVAYVRFASVYREFSDVETFMDELNELLKYRKNSGN